MSGLLWLAGFALLLWLLLFLVKQVALSKSITRLPRGEASRLRESATYCHEENRLRGQEDAPLHPVIYEYREGRN